MPLTLSPDFRSTYPGPFAYSSGSSSVDETFDIYCVATKKDFASLYFWDARLISEIEAHVITAALNRLYDGDQGYLIANKRGLDASEWTAFRAIHPGPYQVAPIECPMYGPGHTVCGPRGKSSVIACFEGDTAMIAQQIAAALNALTFSA